MSSVGVVMTMILLLVSIIIYYYMNTFITLHQCTFNLLFANCLFVLVPFLHILSVCQPVCLSVLPFVIVKDNEKRISRFFL